MLGYIILGILCMVCAGGWLVQYISAASLLYHMEEKNCPFPTEEEMKEGNHFVVRHMIQDFRNFFGGKRQ